MIFVLTLACAPGVVLGSHRDFMRGAVSPDGEIDVADVMLTLRFLFDSGQSDGSCVDAADVDDNGAVQVTDTALLLSYLFAGGTHPAAPFPECGFDDTPDRLRCSQPVPRCAIPIDSVGITNRALYFVVDRSG